MVVLIRVVQFQCVKDIKDGLYIPCNDGRIVGIEFTQSFERRTGKTTGCGIGAADIITVVVTVSVPMPLLTKHTPGQYLVPISDLSKFCDKQWLERLCTVVRTGRSTPT